MWNKMVVEDINNDGRLDIIAGNIGENNFYKIGDQMLVYDFDANGMMEQIVLQKENGKYYPVHDGDEMFSQMPFLKKKFLYYYRFANASIEEVFEKEVLEGAYKLQLEELKSTIFLNSGTSFTKIYLPYQIQLSSVHAICIDTQSKYLYFGGNTYRVKPQYGRQDASLGWSLSYTNNDKTLDYGKP
ncbi:MAG TPA: hypothetical protein PKD85_16965, partial [Saprospiraceae bacterium]|nr:hypothetical protein [Saprospiraceae bacterium]